jgi:multiple sugar transport system permease protein
VLHIYNQAFLQWNSGYASTLAWVLLLIILFFTLVQFRLARRWVYYEAASLTERA